MIAYLDRKTGEPFLEDPSSSSTGVNRFGELAWVSDKYYIGLASYRGRACYVYRQYASEVAVQQDPNALPQEVPLGAASTELKDPKKATIIATAFIDKETMQPLAYETMYEVWVYEKGNSFQAFEIPDRLQEAVRKQAEAVATRQQRYKLRQ
ncbi:MAG: hypothetical protein NTW91_07955 [Verrucomicrobia bacterium]|nr:hypothetical protein [Verrucomicrobiota bacterium]